MEAGIDACLLVDVAPVEHDRRAGIPWQRVDRVAGRKLRPFERREGVLVFLDAELLQVGEAVGEARPVDFRLAVLDRDDIGKVGAAGCAAGERFVAHVAVAHVDDGHLHVRILLVEVRNEHVERLGGDVPAPDGDLARLGIGGAAPERQKPADDERRSEAQLCAHPRSLPVYGRLLPCRSPRPTGGSPSPAVCHAGWE